MQSSMPEAPYGRYRGKRVLVTGANGFLGGHLARRLMAAGAELHGASRTAPASRAADCWHCQDLSVFQNAREVFAAARPQIVFHLTSASYGDPAIGNVLPTFKNDLEATINCLLAAQSAGCERFVMTGSLEEPEAMGNDDGNAIPLAPYAAAKQTAGLYGRMFDRVYGLPVVIVRPFMTYGPGQRPSKVIPYTILSLLKGHAPQLSSGDRRVDWVYIEDVVDGFMAAGVAPGASGLTFELGTAALVSIRDVVRLIGEMIPNSPEPLFGVKPDRGKNRPARTDLAKIYLDWRAKTLLRAGLEETIAYYRTLAADAAAVDHDPILGRAAGVRGGARSKFSS